MLSDSPLYDAPHIFSRKHIHTVYDGKSLMSLKSAVVLYRRWFLNLFITVDGERIITWLTILSQSLTEVLSNDLSRWWLLILYQIMILLLITLLILESWCYLNILPTFFFSFYTMLQHQTQMCLYSHTTKEVGQWKHLVTIVKRKYTQINKHFTFRKDHFSANGICTLRLFWLQMFCGWYRWEGGIQQFQCWHLMLTIAFGQS